MKLAVLGEKQSVLAFRALGAETFGVSSKEELDVAKEKINQSDLAILFITEDIAEKFPKETDIFFNQTMPAALIIPGVKGSLGMGKKALKNILERALGSEMIQLN